MAALRTRQPPRPATLTRESGRHSFLPELGPEDLGLILIDTYKKGAT